MDNILVEVAQIIENSKAGLLSWEFSEKWGNARQYSCESVPGKIVTCIDSNISDKEMSDKVIGLLIAYSARRCLAAWFVYCESTQPLCVIDNVISLWLHHTPLRDVNVDEPSENGVAIIDCRWGDTKSAAWAVEHAAAFALEKDRYRATLSIMYAFLSFALSPAGTLESYVEWLRDFALPCAIEVRRMTDEEQFALADYEIPDVLRRKW